MEMKWNEESIIGLVLAIASTGDLKLPLSNSFVFVSCGRYSYGIASVCVPVCLVMSGGFCAINQSKVIFPPVVCCIGSDSSRK